MVTTGKYNSLKNFDPADIMDIHIITVILCKRTMSEQTCSYLTEL